MSISFEVTFVMLFVLLLAVKLWHIWYCIKRNEWWWLAASFIPFVGIVIAYWRMCIYAFSDYDMHIEGDR